MTPRTGQRAVKRNDKFFSWDWRGQPDMLAIANAVMELSLAGSKVYMGQVDSGTDSYVWFVSDRALSPQQALRLWERTWES